MFASIGGGKAAQITVLARWGSTPFCGRGGFLRTFDGRFAAWYGPPMRQIVAIDPGTSESGYCALRDGVPAAFGTVANIELLQILRSIRPSADAQTTVAIEQMQSYGGPVSTDVFQTLIWSGRLQEAAETSGFAVVYLPRVRVKTHLCRKPNATDAEVWAAVCDRYGVAYSRGKQPAKGTVLHGITGDARQALALGLLLHDEQIALANNRFFTVGAFAPIVAAGATIATPATR